MIHNFSYKNLMAHKFSFKLFCVALIGSALVLGNGISASAATIISDNFANNSGERTPGKSINGVALASGNATWASTHMVFTKTGSLTATGGASAWIKVPEIEKGSLVLEADVNPTGSGWGVIYFSKVTSGGAFYTHAQLALRIKPNGKYYISINGLVGQKHTNLASGTATHADSKKFYHLKLVYDISNNVLSAYVNNHKVLNHYDLNKKHFKPDTSKAGVFLNGRGGKLDNFKLIASTKPISQNKQKASKLVPVNITQFFIAPDYPATLIWSIKNATNNDAEKHSSILPYKITDYYGNIITAGKASMADGKISAHIKLPAGFYEIHFPDKQQTFGIDAITPFQGKTDSFFAIDSALSTQITPTKDPRYSNNFHSLRHGLISILKRSGISVSRERLHWRQINPASGRWDFKTPRSYDKLRQAYANAGVPVLDMFQAAPQYVGRLTPKADFPVDMIKTAQAWTHITNHFKYAWDALEIWNQPDRGSWPADQYVPMVKAIAYTLKHQFKNITIGDASMGWRSDTFRNQAAENGLLNCINFFNVHTYTWAPRLQGVILRYRDWLVSKKHPALPIWITECGRPWSRGTARPNINQDQVSALDITMKAIEARACGVAKYFAFLYVYYGENNFNYGMMGKFATPLRSFAGYAQAIHILSHRPYLGDWPHTNKNIVRGRVFGGSHNAVVVLYTGHPKKGAVVHTSLHPIKVFGIDGRPLKANHNGAIPIPDGLSYVVIPKQEASNSKLKTNTTAMRLYNLAHDKKPAKPSLSPIVLQTLVGKQKFIRNSVKGYWYQPASNITKLTYDIRVNNLGDKAYNIILTPSYHFKSEHAPRQQAQSKSCRVLPSTFKQVSFTINLPAAQDHPMPVAISVAAHIKDNKDSMAISPMVFHLIPELSLKQLLARHPKAVRLPINELSRWHRNWPAKTTAKMSALGDHGWRFNVSFPPEVRNRWAYPRFKWPENIDATNGYKGFIIRERCADSAVVKMFIWTHAKGKHQQGFLTNTKIIPADGQWHAAFVPFTEFRRYSYMNLKNITAISLGLHSGTNSPKNKIEVSGLWLVK